jgi:hypothetical protein
VRVGVCGLKSTSRSELRQALVSASLCKIFGRFLAVDLIFESKKTAV